MYQTNVLSNPNGWHWPKLWKLCKSVKIKTNCLFYYVNLRKRHIQTNNEEGFENQRDRKNNTCEGAPGIWYLHSSDVPGQCMLPEYCERPHTEFWLGKFVEYSSKVKVKGSIVYPLIK